MLKCKRTASVVLFLIMDKNSKYKMSNGVEIPVIGFGTWQIAEGEDAYNSTLHALKVGYRHIDTARAYGNERSVGQPCRRNTIC